MNSDNNSSKIEFWRSSALFSVYYYIEIHLKFSKLKI